MRLQHIEYLRKSVLEKYGVAGEIRKTGIHGPSLIYPQFSVELVNDSTVRVLVGDITLCLSFDGFVDADFYSASSDYMVTVLQRNLKGRPLGNFFFTKVHGESVVVQERTLDYALTIGARLPLYMSQSDVTEYLLEPS